LVSTNVPFIHPRKHFRHEDGAALSGLKEPRVLWARGFAPGYSVLPRCGTVCAELLALRQTNKKAIRVMYLQQDIPKNAAGVSYLSPGSQSEPREKGKSPIMNPERVQPKLG